MSSQIPSRGIVEVTKGGVDLRVPPNTPRGRTWLYQCAIPFQVAWREAAVVCNVREGRVKGVDFENGTDIVLIGDIDNVSVQGAVQVTRNHEEPNPNTDPPGQPAIMVKYPACAGFVPMGAKRADGSPHPHVGTGFGISYAFAWRTEYEGPPPYGVNMWGQDPKTNDLTTPTEQYGYLEFHQFAYDGDTFRVVSTERVSSKGLLAGWDISNSGMSNAIPDGDDLLISMVGGKVGGATGSGVMRWRRQGEEWRPVSFVPVTGEDRAVEPSLIRDIDGTLLFGARGSRDPRYWKAAGANNPDYDIQVWRSDAAGESWSKSIHVRGAISSAPIALNQAADGTPYIAANVYEVFLHPLGAIKVMLDAEGRHRAGGWTRKTLVIWPLNEERTGLETPIVARDCRGEWGPPPGGTTWRIDHPSAMTVRLADGRWHNVMAVRVLEYGELTHAMDPTPRTGTYLEEVISAGQPIPIWNF